MYIQINILRIMNKKLMYILIVVVVVIVVAGGITYFDITSSHFGFPTAKAIDSDFGNGVTLHESKISMQGPGVNTSKTEIVWYNETVNGTTVTSLTIYEGHFNTSNEAKKAYDSAISGASSTGALVNKTHNGFTYFIMDGIAIGYKGNMVFSENIQNFAPSLKVGSNNSEVNPYVSTNSQVESIAISTITSMSSLF